MQTQFNSVSPSMIKYNSMMVPKRVANTNNKSKYGFSLGFIIVFLKCNVSCARTNVNEF